MEVAKILVSQTTGRCIIKKHIPAGLVGGTVSVKYEDPIWDRLVKTVIFRGTAVKAADNFDGETAVIPWEVLEHPGPYLFFGIWGSDPDSALQLPLIEVRIGPIEDATDPTADPGTDPTLPIWAQLKEEIERLKKDGVSDEKIAEAVEDYLAKNPPKVTEKDPTVPDWAKQPQKPTYIAQEVGAISEDNLQGAINTALAQAKDSGEFDGPAGPQGEPGKDYALTPEDKAEIAEMAAGLVEVPDSGGNVDYVGVEPAEDDIPKVFITGVKPTTKDDVLAEMEYVSKTDKFHAYLTIKCQGTSSMSYPKKNFTIKLYSDEARETKLKKSFKDWNHNGNKYVLKANYIDHSHARNIVSARLWGEVVASRPDYDSLPVEMRNAPNNGAVDGFPIKVYYNGTYEGVYTWNIGKDDWQWGMDEDNPNHVLLCAESNVTTANPCNFNALWNGVHESNWSVEVGTNSTALKNSLNNLIQFVMDNNGDDFRNGIGTYLDVQSAIDYYIFQYEICGLDGLAKNMLLATYDGTKWICGAYDLDSTFGLWWNGSSFVSAQYACPENYQAPASLLWERIEANFLPELKARQAELRKTVLSYSNMVTHFERFMDIIGLDLYAEDLTIYTGIPSGSTNNIKQIRNYIRDRQTYVDAEFAAMNGESGGNGDEPDEPIIPEDPVIPDEPSLVYQLPQVTTFNGTAGQEIDTGVQLFAEDKPFTVLLDWEHTTQAFQSNTGVIAHCIHEVSPYPGLICHYTTSGISSEINQTTAFAVKSSTNDTVENSALKYMKVAFIKDADGTLTIRRRYKDAYIGWTDVLTDTTTQGSYVQIEENLLLGCYQGATGVKGRYVTGILNDCKVYNYALPSEEIENWLATGVDTESADPLYALENVESHAVYDRYNAAGSLAYVTITDGNHVKIESENGSNNWYLALNMSSLATNGIDATALTDTWFTVPADANIALKIVNLAMTNVSNNTGFSLRDTNGNVMIDMPFSQVNGKTSHTTVGTATEDTAITCLQADMMLSANASIEFDIEFYVNTERWI